jgi:hypothetical protein
MRFVYTSILTLAAASLVAAQQPTPVRTASNTSHDQSAPQATASRLNGTIRIDGSLNDAQWRIAQPITQFTQLDPSEGKPASERTEIRFLYDDDALYVGAMMYDHERPRGRLGRRDMPMSASDWLTVILDTNHDHITAVGFEVNPLGVRRDQTRSPNDEDDSWEPVWDVATNVVDSGWVAEMRIPFSQLRFSGKSNLVWGLQVERQIARNQEFAEWSFTPREQARGIARFGHLVGVDNVASGKKLELLPYVVARSKNTNTAGNPFRDDHEFSGDAGLDLKYRITSNATLNATVNPDFGQVEVDPAVINLTAFETFFPERRPFFVEGSELFRFGGDGTNQVFYSRRIGHSPTLAPPYAETDVPDVTKILGAAKLTGRTAGGWAMGILDAVTQREDAKFRTPEGTNGESMAEPLTNYFASRMRREARGGQTTIGTFLGAVNRGDLEDGLQNILRKSAYSGGLDFTHRWNQRTWSLNGFLAASHVTGSEAAIIGTQRLPYHYFQRPDADHLEVDSAATSLTGFAGSVNINKQVGRHWNWNAGFNTISPKYEISDLGFQRRADRADIQFGGSYRETRPGKVIRSWQLGVTPLIEHNYDWDMISDRVFINGFAQLLNYWSGNINVTWSQGGTTDDRLTRGGPAADRPMFISVSPFIQSDPRKKIVIDFGGFFQNGDAGHNADFFGDIALKPRPNIEVSLGPSVSFDKAEAQFLGRVADPAKTSTYGTRYLFASVDQTTVALDTRINYTFSPTLSLQVFAQPFVATGDYGATKELDAPRTFRFLEYGRDVGVIQNGRIYPNGTGTNAVSFAVPQPNFNVGSLRGNAVLRWEWRPGSTMYVAWQQTRDNFSPVGTFNFSRDFDNVFQTRPDNIFLVKISYWLNP